MQISFKKVVKKMRVNSLSFRIVIWFLFLSLVPLIIFALHTYQENSINIKRNIINQLAKSSHLKQKYIQNWFNFRFADITSWSQSIYTVGFLSSLSGDLKSNQQNIEDFIGSSSYDKIVKRYEGNLLMLLKNYNYVLDLFLIDKKGNILYAMAEDKELGENILKHPYSSTKLSIAYKKTVSDGQVHFSDVETSKIFKNKIVGHLTAPLNDENGKFIGVIAVQINLDNVFSMFSSIDGYRCYLVGLDSFLRVNISDNKKALKYKIDLKPFVHKGKEHTPSYKNSFGEQVIGMYKMITIGDVNWILVDEVKQSVIIKDEKDYAVSLFMYLFFIAFIVFVIANYIALQITKPLNSLVRASVKISKGDRNLISSSGKDDEVERLINAFNKMITSLAKNEDLLIKKSKELSLSKDKLQQYADELEDRILQEIRKNSLQQQALFNQTRLAQMGEMISMIAHQWRQPLGAIASTSIDLKMKIELELYDFDDKEQIKECQEYFINGLNDVENFTQDLTTTIDDFRNFYKPNRILKEVYIDEPIQKALKIIEYSLITSSITLVKDFTSTKRVKIFDGELMQVVLNIFKNAQDNFKQKNISQAKIWIRTSDAKDKIIIAICDNGGGIDEKIIRKIFDPYFSTKSEKNGTGLGLYMSKMIVEDHHKGKLTAINSDKGVCFTIEIPI